MRAFGSSVLASFFLAASPVFASYDLSRVLEELSNRENSIDTIQFSFKQEINFTQMGNKTTVTGEAMFGKNGKLRIAKETPDKQLTVSDGKKIWVFNPVAKQVWEGNYKKWVSSSVLPKGLVPLNNYVKDLEDNFHLSMLSPIQPGELAYIVATPRKAGLGYSVNITVDSKTWLPVETTYHSESADVVTTLTNHQVNPDIKDSAFQFKAPNGVDVIPFN